MSSPCENSVVHKKGRLNTSPNCLVLVPACSGRVEFLQGHHQGHHHPSRLSLTSVAFPAWHRTAIRHDRRARSLHRIPTHRPPCQHTRTPPRTTMGKAPNPTAHPQPAPVSRSPLSTYPQYVPSTADRSHNRARRINRRRRRRRPSSSSSSTPLASPRLASPR